MSYGADFKSEQENKTYAHLAMMPLLVVVRNIMERLEVIEDRLKIEAKKL